MDEQGDHSNKAFPLFVVSGGVGASGEQLARTVLAQFEQSRVDIEIYPKVHTAERVSRVFHKAASRKALILHSFVDPELRRMAVKTAEELKVEAIDLVGPFMTALCGRLGEKPLGKPGLYRQLYRSYFDRISGMDYTLAHDDGKNPGGWKDAEIVLIGASRVGKTPVSLYLSVLGWRVANIPLVAGIPPPDELFRLDMRRVVGLTITPSELVEHRRHRQRRLGLVDGRSEYVDPVKVFEETDDIERQLKHRGIPIIDVTGKPIETTADEIVRLIQRKIDR